MCIRDSSLGIAFTATCAPSWAVVESAGESARALWHFGSCDFVDDHVVHDIHVLPYSAGEGGWIYVCTGCVGVDAEGGGVGVCGVALCHSSYSSSSA